MTETILLPLVLFWHEAGHLTAAWLCGVPLRRGRPSPVGLSLTFDFSRVTYLTEAFVHLGGALFGITGGVCLSRYFPTAGGVSVMLGVVNLLPIRGLDGYGALNCILSSLMMPDTAWRILEWASVVAWACLWFAAVRINLRVTPNLSLLAFVMALFLKE